MSSSNSNTAAEEMKPINQEQQHNAEATTTGENKKKTIWVRTSDKQLFDVDESIAMQFETVKSYFEDNDDDNAHADTNIMPLPNVASAPLVKIMDFYTERSKVTHEAAIKKFNADFFKAEDIHSLKEILLAVNYLNVKELLDLLTTEFADRIKNKSVQYVRKLFDIENDFTPEEEEKIRQQYAWAFDGVEPDDHQ